MCLHCGEEFKDINASHLMNKHLYRGQRVVDDYRRRFGLEHAMSLATRRKHSVRSLALAEDRRHWTRAKAEAWVRAAAAKGRSLRSTDAPPKLRNYVARSIQQPWEAWVGSLGLPEPEVVRQAWTKHKVLTAIRCIRKAGLPLNSKAMSEHSNPVLKAALRRFDHWDAALVAAGVTPQDVRKAQHWSRESVLAALRRRRDEGRRLDSVSVREEERWLYRATTEALGTTWAKMLKSIGEDPKKHRPQGRTPKWTPETVAWFVRPRLKRNPRLQPQDVPNGLYKFVRQKLELGWRDFCDQIQAGVS